MDRLTKSAHFVPVKTTFTAEKLARIFLQQIVRLHGVPESIVSDRGSTFTSRFWRSFQEAMGTGLDSAVHFTRRQMGRPRGSIRF